MYLRLEHRKGHSTHQGGLEEEGGQYVDRESFESTTYVSLTAIFCVCAF